MSYKYKNISGDTAEELLGPLDIPYNKSLKTINICNTHASDAIEVDLYLQDTKRNTSSPTDLDKPADSVYTYYIIKKYEIANGKYLTLTSDLLKYDYNIYELIIKLVASASKADLIINIS